MIMKAWFAFASFVALELSAGVTQAATQTFSCGMYHFVRNQNTEMITSAVVIRNLDAMFPATVMQITLRDIDGKIVHDSGPAVGIPHPRSFDFPNAHPNGRDMTAVPPLGTSFLRSSQIWGTGPLPLEVGGPEMGQLLTAWIVVSKQGPRNALAVTASERVRSLAATPGGLRETDTRDNRATECQAVVP
jgi:hypothetical protein